jgi:hypothetical protein
MSCGVDAQKRLVALVLFKLRPMSAQCLDYPGVILPVADNPQAAGLALIIEKLAEGVSAPAWQVSGH